MVYYLCWNHSLDLKLYIIFKDFDGVEATILMDYKDYGDEIRRPLMVMGVTLSGYTTLFGWL